MAENKRPKGLSRRELLMGGAAGLVVGAAGTAGLTRVAPGTTPQAQASLPRWDKEADIVVLGAGTISVAAIVAHDAGAKVIMVEKAPVFGGHTSISGGKLWIPNNFVEKQAGISDTREDAYKYLKAVTGGQSNDDLINAYLDNAPVMIEHLRDKAGFKWQPAGWSVSNPDTISFEDYYEGIFPGGRVRGRGVGVETNQGEGGGAALMRNAKRAVEERKIEVMYETPAKRLVTNDKGEVLGVVAQNQGNEISIKAKRAVIVGTGGFERNKEMVLHYIRSPFYFTCGAPGNVGDGILMGMAVGADLRNMNEVWGFVGYNVNYDQLTGTADWQSWRGKPGSITVNKYGERIGNESACYDLYHKAFLAYDTGKAEWRNIPSYTIFDSGYFSHYALPDAAKVGDVPKYFKKFDTLDELAAAFKIDAAGLKTTVERFNENAAQGIDPDWHRGEYSFDKNTAGDKKRTDIKNPCLAPMNPPFYATEMWPGASGTNGGLRTTGKAEVLNVFGQVIPRLYCASNAMASVMGAGYASGGATIGPACTFAYIAAKNAAELKPWDQA